MLAVASETTFADDLEKIRAKLEPAGARGGRLA